jgi:hypothetical protein
MTMRDELSSDVVWVVVESSAVGDTMVGVYTSLAQARAVVASFGRERLGAYRIEGQVLDAERTEATPWQVRLTREGEVLSADAFVGCNCSDDEAEYYRRSFIERGGEEMSVIVFAVTPGQAIVAADGYRAALLARGFWSTDLTPLEPIRAEALEEAAV